MRRLSVSAIASIFSVPQRSNHAAHTHRQSSTSESDVIQSRGSHCSLPMSLARSYSCCWQRVDWVDCWRFANRFELEQSEDEAVEEYSIVPNIRFDCDILPYTLNVDLPGRIDVNMALDPRASI